MIVDEMIVDEMIVDEMIAPQYTVYQLFCDFSWYNFTSNVLIFSTTFIHFCSKYLANDEP